jgi:hypothetical protein
VRAFTGTPMTFAMVFAFIGGSLAVMAALICAVVCLAAIAEHQWLQRELDWAARSSPGFPRRKGPEQAAISSPATRHGSALRRPALRH